MKTVQMTIDEPLLAEVDRVTEALDTSRSAFIREALKEALRRHEIRDMERRHKRAYTKNPLGPEELDVWNGERAWGDE